MNASSFCLKAFACGARVTELRASHMMSHNPGLFGFATNENTLCPTLHVIPRAVESPLSCVGSAGATKSETKRESNEMRMSSKI